MKIVRVLVVDDSSVIRRLMTATLSEHPQIEIAGEAANGRLAVDLLEHTPVDVVLLDVEMPVMDGVSTVREIRGLGYHFPIIMFSTITERGARITFEALAAGATDYVAKPAHSQSIEQSRALVRSELIPRVLGLGGVMVAAKTSIEPAQKQPDQPVEELKVNPPHRSTHELAPVATRPPVTLRVPSPRVVPTHPVSARSVPVRPAVPTPPPSRERGTKPKILIVGCSTGGPEALLQLMRQLPSSLAVPMMIVQHMPPVFTKLLAERLDTVSSLTVREANGGEMLVPGTVFIAPGDFHLEIELCGGSYQTRLTQAAPENFCRPSVDVLFRSVARHYGAAVLGVILTGMGHDGLQGARELAAAGGQIVVQDEATSVVWGMPGVVATAGLADDVVALSDLASVITTRLQSPSRAGAR